MTTQAKHIPFVDLRAQQDRLRDSIEKRIAKVLEHGQYVMGPEVAELEGRLASYVGTEHCITCSSGTDALLMVLMAYNVGPGDAIFTTTFTFIATAEVIALLGATPVFVDIDPQTYNIDPQKLQEAIGRVRSQHGSLRPEGVIAVDLFGQPADYDSIHSIAREYRLFVIEDAAQSFGALYKGRRAGKLGDVGATSFFPAKPLGCYGDGGAIFCDDDDIAEILRSLRIHGKGHDKYDNVRIGVNGRLDTIQAAILLSKLEVFDEELQWRNGIAANYSTCLKHVVGTPHVKADRTSAWAQYSIVTEKRDQVMRELKEVGIPSFIYYSKPLHLQEVCKSRGYSKGDFPITEKLCGSILSLPMHPYLTKEDQEFIISSISPLHEKM